MDRSDLLTRISEHCRASGIAESTFGRLAINDGKLVGRLRQGGRVTAETLSRVERFMRDREIKALRPGSPSSTHAAVPIVPAASRPFSYPAGSAAIDHAVGPDFRFFDNRQKYLMFVHTCSEKRVIANRVALELNNIHPRPPAIRLFDAGVGDGTVLTRLMRAMHRRFPWIPFSIVGKEISYEDVRLTLEKLPDRFEEHPATLVVLTNLYYAEAPWLAPSSVTAASSMVWHEVGLNGATAAEFDEQIEALQPFLSDHWRARLGDHGLGPVYEKPVVLILYREDQRFLLDAIMPRRGAVRADYDMIVASQPYRARASATFKAGRVIAPLARALGPGGRLIGIHSIGGDPGTEIVQRVWPGEQPFHHNRHDILRATRDILGKAARDLNFNAYADGRSLFRFDMHTLPHEIGAADTAIGTSTLFAAWNAATYVAQIEDHRLAQAMTTSDYLAATSAVLRQHGGLWFLDESYVISRKRDAL